MIKISATMKKEKIIEAIKKEIDFVSSYITYQKKLKENITNNSDILSKNNQSKESKNIIQKSFELRLTIDCNIINLQKLIQQLKKMKTDNSEKIIQHISEYNENYKSSFKNIKSNTQKAIKFGNYLYSFIKNNIKLNKKIKILEVPEFDLDPIKSNPELRISEYKKKVFLPYLIDDLKEILEENPNKYSSLKDLINKKYIVPIKYYKNSSHARFKEAYKLIRNKEHGSISQALTLACELFFNYNLNPAVISACKNIDELDIYLDCLEDNELDDFYCFNIVYEVPPTLN